jgi:hypothetical protein
MPATSPPGPCLPMAGPAQGEPDHRLKSHPILPKRRIIGGFFIVSFAWKNFHSSTTKARASKPARLRAPVSAAIAAWRVGRPTAFLASVPRKGLSKSTSDRGCPPPEEIVSLEGEGDRHGTT